VLLSGININNNISNLPVFENNKILLIKNGQYVLIGLKLYSGAQGRC
jgi:hypothetical protein